MIQLIGIVILILLFILIQMKVYIYYWNENLEVDLKFGSTDMFAGDTAVKTVEMNGIVSFSEGLYVSGMFPNIQSFTAKDAEELPDRMFADCTSLTTITLPELYTLGDEVFKNCNLSDVVIYADDIGVNAFDGNPLTTARFDYLEKIECDIFGSSKSVIEDLKMMRSTCSFQK